MTDSINKDSIINELLSDLYSLRYAQKNNPSDLDKIKNLKFIIKNKSRYLLEEDININQNEFDRYYNIYIWFNKMI